MGEKLRLAANQFDEEWKVPSEPLKQLLDRDLAKVSGQPIIEIAVPLLRELVNHATNAWRRCQVSATGSENEDLAALILYRQVIEMVDGVEVLIQEACSVSTIPLLRSAFESALSLEFILIDDSKYIERSLSWFCAHVHRRISWLEQMDPATTKGAEFKKAWEKSFGSWNPPSATAPSVAGQRAILASPQLQPIEAEYQNQPKKNPNWYSLFGGPNDLRTLAEALKRAAEYDTLYRAWSTVIHANDPLSFMRADAGGIPHFTSIRFPENLAKYAFFASTLLIRATRLMLGKFRSGEDIRPWYMEEVRDMYHRLGQLNVEVSAIP